MSQGFTKGTPIDTDPTLSLDSDIVVPSQSAVKAYVASQVGTPVTDVTATAPLVSSSGTTPNLSITDAVADGSTKGAATFTASDFNSASGVISIDYANAQKASASQPGFLTAADFNLLKRDTFTIRTAIGGFAPADATTYFFSEQALTNSVNATLYDALIPVNCTLVAAIIYAANTTANATNETSTVNFRVNNTTDTLLSNAVIFGGTVPIANAYSVTGLSTNLTAGDTFILKWTTPTWATNPTNAQLVVILYFERT